ncbi:receptor-type tyrosine-protein phosphatase kappa-like [Mya arenaria]|uniref:receptor-type tyrosine-protein phosphatase kappa-like n=1 Tax=Mya arenaria TaxID=6604 RepID=UPI0022DF1F37|nr:receptor-type tyrosine-protein phosphatase kappa-like [Mya arenaria]
MTDKDATFPMFSRGTLPWRAVEMRVKERRDRKEKSRNFSIVSQVFENNIKKEDPPKLKRNNSNRSSYKLSESKPRGTVAVDNFWEYVKEHTASRTELTQQFKDLVIGLCHPCETAKKAQNVRKNRYKEIFAYDHTRVKLEELPGDDGNDYINASYISGYNKPHMYIAAQGPTEEFVSDFWRMIWQKQCRKIVMLTRLVEHNKVKCCQYWPDEGRKQYGGVTVEARDADTFSDYTVRTFVISTEKGESRVVKHFQFEAWSDRHVPEYASSVLHFRGCVQAHDSKDNVPTVVHCSAGIGRSGTYLALDYLAEQADVEGYVNVFQCVQNLRHQRVNMVQNLEQYMFLHEALAEALFCPNAALPADRFAASYQRALEAPAGGKQPRLELEFQRLQHVTKFHESMKPSFYEGEEYRAARAFENTQKNRTRNILPSDLHRPFLTTRVADTNDYINAVFLPSYRESKSFLLTQNPLADTIIDFWRMVYENNVCTIVNMDTISRQYEVYWPSESETVTFIPFQLHFVTEVDHVTHIERTIKLTNAEEPKEKARLIKQYECRFWMSESHVPVGAESSLLAVCDHAAKWQTANGNPPIVAHCQNGATKSGLFCVVMATVERVKQERDVALQQTVKQMRINRHQIIPTFEQYKFIHDVVIDFLRATELLPT